MEDINEHIRQRIKKLAELRSMGINPYGKRFETENSAGELLERYNNKSREDLENNRIDVTTAGRIIALRDFGKASFAHIQNTTGRIQVYIKKELITEEDYALFKRLDIGDFIGVKGHLFKTRTGELTIQVEGLTFLAKSLRPLPEKWHGLTDVEIRYRQRYVDLIVNPEVKKVFEIRSRIIKAVRDFLEEKGFIEVETPMMQLIPGGAAARPFLTHHNALNIPLYLRIAPELYLKRLIVGGFERVYELNRNFRNEGISTTHNPEFTMLEFYMAYADYKDLMNLTQEMLTSVCKKVLGTLQFEYKAEKVDLTPPWKRYTLKEAVLEHNQLSAAILEDRSKAKNYAIQRGISVHEDEPLGKIINKIFEETVEPKLIQPTFITDYPVDISPLAKRREDNPEITERFELFIGGREIANAFSELNDPEDQRQRFEKQVAQREAGDEEAHLMDHDYIRALEYGMPPTAGEGIGIDRLVMVLTNQTSIKDVILFPLLKPED